MSAVLNAVKSTRKSMSLVAGFDTLYSVSGFLTYYIITSKENMQIGRCVTNETVFPFCS